MITILLAEDDDTMREHLGRALERAGYAVAAVENGVAALMRLRNGRFDLLLTDIVMPEMDGIELAGHAATLNADMHVMFITGFAAMSLERSIPADAKILSKPFHLRDLVTEVDRTFRRTRVADA